LRRNMPAGGRYTRPRRGYRTRSHYSERLKKRGQTSKTVAMPDMFSLRKRQASSDEPTPMGKRYIPEAPFVPLDAQRKKGGKARVYTDD
jgi:hypothetical protein